MRSWKRAVSLLLAASLISTNFTQTVNAAVTDAASQAVLASDGTRTYSAAAAANSVTSAVSGLASAASGMVGAFSGLVSNLLGSGDAADDSEEPQAAAAEETSQTQASASSDSKWYALTVQTGNQDGEGIGLFAIDYIYTEDGVEKTAVQYILPFDGDYEESLKIAEEAQGETTNDDLTYLNQIGYTMASYDQATPLSVNSVNTYLAEFEHQVTRVTSIEVYTDIGVLANATTVTWRCEGMEFYHVDEVQGMGMNGSFSTSYSIIFDGSLMASLKLKNTKYYDVTAKKAEDTVWRVVPNTGEGVNYELVYPESGTQAEKSSYKDVYVEIDLADVYGGGIEAFSNPVSSKHKTISNWYLPETLKLKLNYETTSGANRTVTVPVVASALAYALEQGYITKNTSLAEFMGQGSTLMLKLRLQDYKGISQTTGNMTILYDPTDAASSCGLIETKKSKTNHQTLTAQIMNSEAPDTISLLGVYVYDNLTEEEMKEYVSVDEGTLLKYDVKKSPSYYYSSGTYKGETIEPTSNKTSEVSYQLRTVSKGAVLRPSNPNTNYVIIMKTTDSDLAATNDQLQLKLGYITKENGAEQYTDTYNVEDLVKNYYGYWPGKEGSSTVDAAYQVSLRKGSYLYCLVNLEGVYKFTSATFTLDGRDPWQCQDFYIYQVGQTNLDERHIVWTDLSNGDVSTDRQVYRDFNKNQIGNTSTESTDVKSDIIDYGDTETEEDTTTTTTEKSDTINVSGLGQLSCLVELEDVEVYLDSAHKIKQIEFADSSNATVTNIETVDWRSTGLYTEMPYEETQKDLGFTISKKSYTVAVKVGTEAFENSNGDAGSSNYFYFQLVFENGCSSYVQANQQLAADGFIEGQTATFTIKTNYNYGNLTAINVIPDDSASTADPYDKLKIESITVSTMQDDNTALSWVCNTNDDNAWVGIDYVEQEQESAEVTTESRDLEDILTTYTISETTKSTPVLVAIATGNYSTSKQLQASSLYATFNVTRLDGTQDTVDADVIYKMYDFTGEEPLTTELGTQYLTNPDTMLRNSSYNYFIVLLDDVKTIDSVDFDVVSTEDDIVWTISDVELYKITKDNGRKINAQTDTYVLDGTTEMITSADLEQADCSIGWQKTLSPQYTTEYHIPFLEQTTTVAEATTLAFEQNREPVSNNDYLNIGIYMKNDGTKYDDCTMSASIVYTNTFKSYYKTSPTLKRKTSDDGQTIFYANGVGAKNLKVLESATLYAQFASSGKSAYADHIIIQRIRDGVIIDTLYFECGDKNVSMFSQKFVPNTIPVLNPDYQVVTLALGEGTTEADLTAEKSDIAVAIRYTLTTGDESKVYQSPYIYLTDQNITSVGPNRLVKVKFEQRYVKEIKGISVAVTGNFITAEIETASVGLYTYGTDPSIKTSDSGGSTTSTTTTTSGTSSTGTSSGSTSATGTTDSTTQTDTSSTGTTSGTTTETATTVTPARLASDCKTGYYCSGWYSLIVSQKITAGSGTFSSDSSVQSSTYMFSASDSVKGDYKAIVPMKVTFNTMDATDSLLQMGVTNGSETGINSGAMVDVVFIYTGEDGNSYIREFTNILDYAEQSTSTSFTTGSSDVVAFMEQNMTNISGIVIRPYDGDDTNTPAYWGLKSITLSYGDGADVADQTITVNQVIHEDDTNDTTYPGYYVGIKSLRISTTEQSVGADGTVLHTETSASDSTDETIPILRISQLNGYVQFTAVASNTLQGLKVMAGRDSDTDASQYLSVINGTTLKFAPPTSGLTTEVKYLVQAYANENSKVRAKFYVIVDAGLHQKSCSITTSDVKAGEKAVFTFTLSDAVTETSDITATIGGTTYEVEVLSGQKVGTQKVDTTSSMTSLTATASSVKGRTSGSTESLTSNTAICTVTGVSTAKVTLSASASSVTVGDSCTITVKISEAPKTDITIDMAMTSPSGSESSPSVVIAAGSTSATKTIKLSEAGTYSLMVTKYTGGGFDSVSYAGAEASITATAATTPASETPSETPSETSSDTTSDTTSDTSGTTSDTSGTTSDTTP